MNRLIKITIFALLVTCFAIPVFAQKKKSKDDYLKEFAKLAQTKKPEDLDRMYELGKGFINDYPNEKNDNVNKIKGFLKQYRENKFYNDLEKGKYAEGFAAGKEILAENPEDVAAIMNLAYAGYDAFTKNKDNSFEEQSIGYAKQTLKLLEANKVPTNFSPFKDKNDVSAWMYYIMASFVKDKDIREGAINFYQATRFDSPIKNNSYPFYVVAVYYEDVYQKLATEYNGKLKTLTDAQSAVELEKVNKVIDLMLDAYARAIKLAEIENIPEKVAWKSRLTDVYKFRKKTDAGINEYMTLVNASPMPDPSAL